MQRVRAPKARPSFPWHQNDFLGSMDVFTTDSLAGTAMIHGIPTELYTRCTLNNDNETASVRQPSSYRSASPQFQNQKAASIGRRTGPNQHGVYLLAGHIEIVKHVARMRLEPSPTTSSLKVPPAAALHPLAAPRTLSLPALQGSLCISAQAYHRDPPEHHLSYVRLCLWGKHQTADRLIVYQLNGTCSAFGSHRILTF
jgi:hypothetical protein